MIINMNKYGRKLCYTDNKKFICHNNYGPWQSRSSGYKSYKQNDEFHNEHGPAIKPPDRDYRYYLDGISYSYIAWKAFIRKNKN